MLYIPPNFRETDLPTLHAFMREHPFAIVASHGDSLHVSHLPLMVLPERGPNGTLLGHFARANSHWHDFESGKPVICVFRGPHAFISTSWYQNQPSVPTWNYAVVHATGRPKLITDPGRMAELMQRTMAEFDPSLLDPATHGHPPQEYIDALTAHIVGFEIKIDTIEGKFKLGQNRSAADQAGIAAGLEARDGADSDLLSLTRKRGEKAGHSDKAGPPLCREPNWS